MAEKETCAESQAEKEMREARVPTPKSLDELQEYIKGLVEREHDYGTCVRARYGNTSTSGHPGQPREHASCLKSTATRTSRSRP